MRMHLGHLALKVYAYSVIAGLATISVFIVSFHFIVRNSDRDGVSALMDHLVAEAWQDRASPSKDGAPPGPGVTVYSIDGRLVSSTSEALAPMLSEPELRQLEDTGHLDLEGGVIARPIREDGRLVGVGIVDIRPPSPGPFALEFIVPLGVLSLVFLVTTMVFARHVADPLQRLASVAGRFGRGELDARSGIRRNDEIGELGRAFDDMADRVTSLMAIQQELLVNVSHELLTPMSRIRVAVDLVSENSSQAIGVASGITSDLLELEHLLDDVMTVARFDLSRLKVGSELMPLRRERVSVVDLIEDAVSRFRMRHTAHQVAVDVPSKLPALVADAVLLRRVLENLLENARKYSDRGTTIFVRATATEGTVTLSVADEGIGIQEADLQKVFIPFFRSDKSRSRATGGVGLGLALASRVVEAHGGAIDVTSQPGKGTTVRLKLPNHVDSRPGRGP